jgi:hypothetical protein
MPRSCASKQGETPKRIFLVEVNVIKDAMDYMGNVAIDIENEIVRRKYFISGVTKAIDTAVDLWRDSYDGVRVNWQLGDSKEMRARVWLQVVMAELREKRLRAIAQWGRNASFPYSFMRT